MTTATQTFINDFLERRATFTKKQSTLKAQSYTERIILRLSDNIRGYMKISFARDVWVISVGCLVWAFGYSLMIPFLALYLFREFGASMALIGVTLMVYSIFGKFFQLFGGFLSDKFGRKTIILFGLGVESIAYLGYASASSLLLFMILACFAGFAGSFYLPAANALIADVVEPNKRGRAYGLLNVFTNVGVIAGPFAATLIVGRSFKILFICASIATAIYFFLVLLYVQEPETKWVLTRPAFIESIKESVSNHPFLFFCIVTVASYLIYVQITLTLPLFCSVYLSIVPERIGTLFILNGILVVSLQHVVATFVDNHKWTASLSLGTLLMAVGLGLFGVSQTLFHVAICVVIFTLGELFFGPAVFGLVADMAPEELVGSYMGFSGLFQGLGYSAGYLFGGVAMDIFAEQITVMWALFAALGIAGCVAYFFVGLTIYRKKEG
jgi:MFS family permease